MTNRILSRAPIGGAIRASVKSPAARYWICVHDHPGGDRYSLRRTHPKTAVREYWTGRERGWIPGTVEYPGKLYSRYADAYKTLRKLQDADRERYTTRAGRSKRQAEREALALKFAQWVVATYPELVRGQSRDGFAFLGD